MKYRPEIDGLRALAVVPVIFFHAGFRSFGGGFVGVDVFFVISGYLIAGIIFHEIKAGAFSFGRFYERRARRILPMILAVCVVCIPPAWQLMLPQDYLFFSKSLVAVGTFSSNILFWRESGYFDAPAEYKPLLHTWSLSVEEQFYLFFPILLVAMRGLRQRWKVFVLGSATLSSLGLAMYGANAHPAANFFLIPTRAWELGVGALLALIGQRDVPSTKVGRETAALFGVALILYAIVQYDRSTPFPGLHALIPVMGAALIIHAATPGTLVARVLSLPALVGVGLVSYSLYLWHQPMIAFMRLASLHRPSTFAMWLAIGLSSLLSLVSWKWIEMPFRDKQRISRRTLICVGTIGTCIVLTVGVSGTVADGFPTLTPSRAKKAGIADRLRVNYGLSEVCDGASAAASACRSGDLPDVVVWGDSYAMHLVSGILADDPNVALAQMTKSVCGPIIGLAPVTARHSVAWAESCLEFNRQVLRWIEDSGTIKVAILSSPFSQYLDPENSYLTESGVQPVNPETLRSAFQGTLNELRRIGIRPIVVGPPPSFGENIGQCLARAHAIGVAPEGCNFRRASYESERQNVINFLRNIERINQVVWLADYTCGSEICSVVNGQTLIYRDDVHLSYEGSAYLGAMYHFYSRALSETARDGGAAAAALGAVAK